MSKDSFFFFVYKRQKQNIWNAIVVKWFSFLNTQKIFANDTATDNLDSYSSTLRQCQWLISNHIKIFKNFSIDKFMVKSYNTCDIPQSQVDILQTAFIFYCKFYWNLHIWK